MAFCAGAAAASGQVQPATPEKATTAALSQCSHFSAVCGGIYLSTLPNCSAGPDIYDLNVAAGVHIVAAPAEHSTGNNVPVEVTILGPSGAQIATGTNGAEGTTTEAGVHNIVVSASQPASYELHLSCSPNPGCVSTPGVLCLNDDRFAVSAMWWSPTGSGSATGVKLTGDTGYFWFFDPANVELVTKVLNGCTITGAYWVFAGGLTNVEVVLTVVDTLTGAAAFYYRSPGPAFEPIQDTKALTTCP